MFPSFEGGSDKHSAVVRTERARYTATDCGTFDSTSIYPLARVFALRRVSCSRAIEVAKAYDGQGKVPGHWRCALAHGGGSVLLLREGRPRGGGNPALDECDYPA